MIDYQDIKNSYIRNNSDGCNVQIDFLDRMQKIILKNGRKLLLKKLEAPSAADYAFFNNNFNFLIPLFVESYNGGKDLYCLDVENELYHKISVFSVDGIVHNWETVDEFILWLIEKSGYLED